MKRFRFSLESVLTYRMNLEDKEKQLLAAISGHLATEKNQLDDLRKKYAQAELESMGGEGKSSLNENETELYRLYLKRLSHLIKAKGEQVQKLQFELEKQKEQVLKAYKNRRLLEMLKKKRFQAFCTEADKQEQKFVDELQLVKFIGEKAQ